MNKKCADERLKLIKQWIEGDKKELGLKCLKKTLEKGFGTGLAYREFPDFNQVMKENVKENEEYWFDVFIGYMEELVMDKSMLSALDSKYFAIKIFQLIGQGHISNVEKIAVNIRERIFWKEGYIAIRNKLYFKDKYPNYIIIRMQEIEELLKPKNLEEEALFWCASHTHELYFVSGHSFEEANEMRGEKLRYYGKILAEDLFLFKKVHKELVLADADTIQLGRELDKSPYCSLMWDMLCEVLKENEYIPGMLNMMVGMLIGQNNIDEIKEKLGVLLQDSKLNRAYVALVVNGNYFADEIVRFHNIVKSGKVDISIFYMLSGCQGFLNLSIDEFMEYMQDFIKYDNCDAVIWDLVASKVRYEAKLKGTIDEKVKKMLLTFLSGGRISIYGTSLNSIPDIALSCVKTVISSLCNNTNGENKQYIIKFYEWMKDDIEGNYTIGYDADTILDELYKKQPILFLNVFVENSSIGSNILRMIKKDGRVGRGILSKNHLDILISWCNAEPDKRYHKIFDCTYGYEWEEGKFQWKN